MAHDGFIYICRSDHRLVVANESGPFLAVYLDVGTQINIYTLAQLQLQHELRF